MADEAQNDVQPCRVCATPTTNKCSSCKLVSYCSKDHQKEDWKNHKDICRPFEIKSTPELGRYLEANRKINVGDVIFSEFPIVIGPRPDDVICLGCYSPDPQERCPHCFWPVCSITCEGLSDPDHHGSECLILRLHTRRVKYLTQDFFRFEAILPLRCLLLQRRNPKKWKILVEMESHYSKKRGPNTEIHKQIQERVVNYLTENFFHLVKQVEEESKSEAKLIPDRTSETIHKICGIIDVNALEIRLPNQSTINGLYPTAYLMEHNCLPNTRHVFSSPTKFFKITILANQDVPAGNHISTMYTHALWGTQQRQEHLRSTKYFTCRCRRCGDPTELGTFISALRCLAPGTDRKICGGSQLPIAPLDVQTEWRCDKCPTSLTSSQVSDLVNMIGGEVDHVQEDQPTIEKLQNLLEKLRKLLHRNHYHCYAVMHSLIQLYGRQPGYLPEQMNDLLVEKKIKMCKELLAVTLALDPTASRLALYSSVIEYEEATAIMILAKRKIWSGDQLTERLAEAKRLLLHAKKSLEPEEENSPGAKIAEVADKALAETEAYAKFAGVSI